MRQRALETCFSATKPWQIAERPGKTSCIRHFDTSTIVEVSK